MKITKVDIDFKPVRLVVTLETLEELRELWHRCAFYKRCYKRKWQGEYVYPLWCMLDNICKLNHITPRESYADPKKNIETHDSLLTSTPIIPVTIEINITNADNLQELWHRLKFVRRPLAQTEWDDSDSFIESVWTQLEYAQNAQELDFDDGDFVFYDE
jgi:hypothetical protein